MSSNSGTFKTFINGVHHLMTLPLANPKNTSKGKVRAKARNPKIKENQWLDDLFKRRKDSLDPVEINEGEQWERCNVLLLIIATLLIVNTSFLLGIAWPRTRMPAVIQINKTLYKEVQVTQGFPELHLALVSGMGIIKDFSLDGPKSERFPKLPQYYFDPDFDKQQMVNMPYPLFAVSFGQVVYYISGNPKALVTKHFVDEGAKSHRLVHGSNIPHSHIGPKVVHLQVGNFFWIVGGFDLDGKKSIWDSQTKSSIWVLHREIWTRGPDFPEADISGGLCAVGINSSVGVFYSIEMKRLYAFNFKNFEWRFLDETDKMSAEKCTLTTLIDKDQKLKIAKMGYDSDVIFMKTFTLFDMDSQLWEKHGLIVSPGYELGSLVSLRGNLFYFHFYESMTDEMAPIYKLKKDEFWYLEPLLDEEIPFLNESKDASYISGLLNCKVAPYYHRKTKYVTIQV